jgi:hypothetical protein
MFTYDKFSIKSISYNDNREITGLAVINQDGNIVYQLAEKGNAPKAEQKQESERTQEINKELARTGVALDAVLERYGVSSIQEMDNTTYRKAMNSLKKTKAKAA